MPTASWNQLERAIEHLHAAAREPIGVREFYRQLVAEAVAALDAAGGAAWRPGAGGRPELICQSLPDDGVEADWSARLACVEKTTSGAAARFVDGQARLRRARVPRRPACLGDRRRGAAVAVDRTVDAARREPARAARLARLRRRRWPTSPPISTPATSCAASAAPARCAGRPSSSSAAWSAARTFHGSRVCDGATKAAGFSPAIA